MSARIKKAFLSRGDIEEIKNDCFVQGRENDYGPPATLRAYGETASSLYLPFSYARDKFKESPNKEYDFTPASYSFYSEKYPYRSDGGRDQAKVAAEAVKMLKTRRSVLLSLFCGFGKCLALDTPILMFNGDIKPVQDVRIGDLLMGDDLNPRTVLSLARGNGEMFKVIPQDGSAYVVNKDHLLSLYIAENKKISKFYSGALQVGWGVSWFDHEKSKIVTRIFYTSRYQKVEYAYETAVDFAKKLNSPNTVDLTVELYMHLPVPDGFFRGYKVSLTGEITTTRIRIVPVGIADYYGFMLSGNGRFLLGDRTVTHNTYLGIRLAQITGLKTGILAHRSILIDQWEESIKKFTNAKVQRVDTDGILDPDADFYIFNIAYVHKRWDKSTKSWRLKKLGVFKSIGLLIVDEAHIACAEEMARALLYFNPRMNIALTATPVRKDGMDKLLELYFGDYSDTRIIRVAQNPFTVYRLPTDIKPDFLRNKFGKKDWNSVIDFLINDKKRNKLIVDLVVKFCDYNIIILTKRKSHCSLLSKKLSKLGISNTVMVGTKKTYDKTARVLLSTYSKLGVGFDDSRLNMLIVACSVTEVEQYAGRLRDAPDKQRIIIDLVDNDGNCLKHWRERRKWYVSRNGKIVNYFDAFPKVKAEVEVEQDLDMNAPRSGQPKRLARRI